ncbi:S-adenosylhomocysteine deaminase [Halalkalibacter wakoensis JCM 9140]|uniref:S-adenosylhomocysteine deaminase n=1 Tax=Halalkalibacter wakoensis JCM 9140 TaxID=1236970 RepID=W4Q7A5_9BACI|nr:amidohydrolase family protein [Halalkalibacter wakoensis]GAE27573.1 S-adenosylhomocysteine deaminase [Halalkalibacter wakoensis JCM 9140]
MKIDTLIVHADLFTMQGKGVGYIDNGAVAIDAGKIVAVGPTDQLQKEYTAEERIDATNKMVLPGFVDAHLHSYWGILRGVAQDTSMWMHKGVGPFRRYLTDENRLAGSKMNILEGLAAGTTTFCDYSTPILDIAQFYKQLGARARLTCFIKEVPDVLDTLQEDDLYPFEPAIGEKTLHENLELVDRWHGYDDNRITATLGPQGPDFLSVDLMKKVKNIANEKQLKIHMHVAQAARETKQMVGRYNKRSIAFLDEIGYLDDSLIAVHLTDATKEEVELLVEREASMVVCSGAIGIIRGEVPPACSFLEAGGNVGLGSDQSTGNNCNQMINEMKLTALFNKIKYKNPEVLPAWKVLRMATVEGAKAVGLGDEIGSLEVGKKADIVFVDLTAKTMQPVIKSPMRNHVPNLVYSARGHEVCRVLVNGQTLYENGKYLTVNEEDIVDQCQRFATETTEKVTKEHFRITNAYEFMKQGQL